MCQSSNCVTAPLYVSFLSNLCTVKKIAELGACLGCVASVTTLRKDLVCNE